MASDSPLAAEAAAAGTSADRDEARKAARESRPSQALNRHEAREVYDHQALAPRVVHEVIRLQGNEELDRPAISLLLSGLAGGAAVSASVLGEAIIALHLGHSGAAALVAPLGYAIGFIIVIMGRLQLFTENTLSAVLPLVDRPTLVNLGRLARLWTIVFIANLAGTLLVAWGAASGAIASPALLGEILLLSRHILASDPVAVMLLGIPAGFLIAALVWLMPASRGSELGVIVALTWLIAAGGFTHVIASSGAVWAALLVGDTGPAQALTGFLLPALAGNVIGGTGLFAVLANGQVRAEL